MILCQKDSCNENENNLYRDTENVLHKKAWHLPWHLKMTENIYLVIMEVFFWLNSSIFLFVRIQDWSYWKDKITFYDSLLVKKNKNWLCLPYVLKFSYSWLFLAI